MAWSRFFAGACCYFGGSDREKIRTISCIAAMLARPHRSRGLTFSFCPSCARRGRLASQPRLRCDARRAEADRSQRSAFSVWSAIPGVLLVPLSRPVTHVQARLSWSWCAGWNLAIPESHYSSLLSLSFLFLSSPFLFSCLLPKTRPLQPRHSQLPARTQRRPLLRCGAYLRRYTSLAFLGNDRDG